MPLAASSIACLLLTASSVAVPPVEAPRPDVGVLLSYRFAPGETIAYRIEHAATFLATKAELREKNFSRTRTEQRFEVLSVDAEGTATLRVVIDHARMEYAFNDEEPSVFDSAEKKLPAPVFESVARVIGQPLAEVRVRRDGKVEAARPLQAEADMSADSGKAATNGDGPTSLFTTLPDRPVCVGEEWTDTFQTKVAVTRLLSRDVTILRQYRLESVTNGVATVAIKTSPLTTITEPGQLVQLIQRTTSGRIRFDIRAGRVIGRNVEADNVEVGWAGANSSYRARCTWNEQLVTDAKVSAR